MAQARAVGCRVKAAVSQPSLVEAHRKLLQAALTNPQNTMFLLISEVCVPLHHPALLWAQLMAESHVSRVDDKAQDMQRFKREMAYGALTKATFQKSSQWVSLTRMHALLVLKDDHVWPRFDNFCRTGVCMHSLRSRCPSLQRPAVVTPSIVPLRTLYHTNFPNKDIL